MIVVMLRHIPKVKWSVVHRTNDVGIDLPPGTSAAHLEATDYHPVEMGPRDGRDERGWLARLVDTLRIVGS
jgi:hypothetical protein